MVQYEELPRGASAHDTCGAAEHRVVKTLGLDLLLPRAENVVKDC